MAIDGVVRRVLATVRLIVADDETLLRCKRCDQAPCTRFIAVPEHANVPRAIDTQGTEARCKTVYRDQQRHDVSRAEAHQQRGDAVMVGMEIRAQSPSAIIGGQVRVARYRPAVAFRAKDL